MTIFLVVVLIVAIVYVKRKKPDHDDEMRYKNKIDTITRNTLDHRIENGQMRNMGINRGSTPNGRAHYTSSRSSDNLDSSRDTTEGEEQGLCGGHGYPSSNRHLAPQVSLNCVAFAPIVLAHFNL